MTLVSKSFSEIVTFSRSSNATRVGPTGLVEYAPHNLIQRSQEFDNAYWSKTASSVTANTTSAPDGTVTADSLIENSADAQHYLSRNLGTLVGTHTVSFYAKANGRNWIAINLVSAADNRTFFNLSTGVVGTNASGNAATITSVGNGWYRCSVSRTLDSATWFVELYLASSDGTLGYTGNGTSGIHIWGAQLSVGPYALDYTPTTSAAVYGPRFDYDGSGVTIVEPVSRNLLTYSEQFDNAAWGKLNSTISANSAIAPDGQTTADKLIETTSNTSHGVDAPSASVVSGTAYTASVFAKAAERRYLFLALNYSVFQSGNGVCFDLQTGTIAATGSGSASAGAITSVGNGWYRCSITLTATATSSVVALPAIYLANAAVTSIPGYVGDGTSGIFIWGAQLEVGSTATGYMVSGATNGFRAVPVVSGSATARGLLVEEQRTNLALYSEDFSNAAWTQSFLTENITANSATSPSGQVTADTISDSSGNSEFAVGQNISATANVPNTFSVFAKANGSNFLYLRYYGNLEQYYYTVIFDLSLGTATKSQIGSSASNGSNTITSVGNGWYRLTVTATVNSATLVPMVGIAATGTDTIETFGNISVNGTGNRSCFIWGAQLEAGSFATSYIPTLASTVTRSADVASVNTLSPFYNAVEGTIYAEWSMVGSKVGTGYPAIAQFDDTTATNYIAIRQDGTGDSRRYGIVNTSSTQTAMLSSTAESLSANTVLKSALAYKANDFAFVRGSTLGTSSSGAIPAVTNLKFGRNEAGTYTNAHVRRIAYFPRRLQNAELQALTA